MSSAQSSSRNENLLLLVRIFWKTKIELLLQWKLKFVPNILWMIVDTHFKKSLAIEEEVVIERADRMKTVKNKKCNALKTIVCRILQILKL